MAEARCSDCGLGAEQGAAVVLYETRLEGGSPGVARLCEDCALLREDTGQSLTRRSDQSGSVMGGGVIE